MTSVSQERRDELTSRLDEARQRIDAACRSCGRSDTPTLIVVTKFFPVEDLVALAEAGVRDVGENREQELLAKSEYLDEFRPDVRASTQLHFIGQLQSKKAKRVGSLADVVHSVDRSKLVRPLASAAAERGVPVKVLLQVDLEAESHGRGGVRPGELPALAQLVAQEPLLQLEGLMAVAPLGEESAAAFARLAEIRASFLADHPEATVLSAGMSGDLEDAVAIGATHLRVGSAILGSRPTAG